MSFRNIQHLVQALNTNQSGHRKVPREQMKWGIYSTIRIDRHCQSNRSNKNGHELSIFTVLLRVVARFSAHDDDTTLRGLEKDPIVTKLQ